MERIKLESVHFKKLKSLSDVTLNFSDTLTAIMGVNGAGKSTVIHALACLYQPDGKGENHKFPEFFVPNTDAQWSGSELYAINAIQEGETWKTQNAKKYSKEHDRWSPKYKNRPKRNVYYVGIDTCLPDIERQNATSRIMYRTNTLSDRTSEKIIESAGFILNKNYESLLENKYREKMFPGVELRNGLKYSTLSMGSGEQRVIKIISYIENAEPYSLILIDEIDLLLHVSALHRIIKKIYEIAKRKNLQIVFTTHSLEMMKLEDHVSIQYILNVSEEQSSQVYERITPDLVYSMTGITCKPYTIYVEDKLAKELISQIVHQKSLGSSIDIINYGSIENAFTLAAGFVLQGLPLNKVIIVLDGDKHCTIEEKKTQITKRLTGTEEDIESKREKALSIITEFKLPSEMSPEKYLHETVLRCVPKENEIHKAAQEIKAVNDSHDWINGICNRLGVEESFVAHEVFRYSKDDDIFKEYIGEIEKWIDSRDSGIQ